MNPMARKLYEMYRGADHVRCSFHDLETARKTYGRYVQFIRAFAQPCGRLLDIGCGTGWSTYFLAEAGFDATGIDLNPKAFETPELLKLALMEGSAVSLQFPDDSFDIVAAHQTLEHVSDPKKMINEMLRVVRPCGIICIVGPNLVSVGNCLRAAAHAWRNRPRYRAFFRGPGMARHPFGNTFPEAVGQTLVTLGRIVRKSFEREPCFLMREPDLIPPFHGDNDAVYRCNPLDLMKYLRGQRCEVLQSVALGRYALTRMIAGGTWIAARKSPSR